MAKSIKEEIVGTWKLVSWTYQNEKGEVIDYFGKNPVGILMYDKYGYMNAQLMTSNRTKFASEAIDGGTNEEMGQAFKTYLAYFGHYVEAEPGAVVHTVLGSLFPNWLEQQHVRYGQIDGDKLVLSTPPISADGREIVFYITWRKISAEVVENQHDKIYTFHK
jgi:hypothetical protein